MDRIDRLRQAALNLEYQGKLTNEKFYQLALQINDSPMLEDQDVFNHPIYYPAGTYKAVASMENTKKYLGCISPTPHKRVETGWYRAAGKKEEGGEGEEKEKGEEKEEEKKGEHYTYEYFQHPSTSSKQKSRLKTTTCQGCEEETNYQHRLPHVDSRLHPSIRFVDCKNGIHPNGREQTFLDSGVSQRPKNEILIKYPISVVGVSKERVGALDLAAAAAVLLFFLSLPVFCFF